jgi:hypothetical protein
VLPPREARLGDIVDPSSRRRETGVNALGYTAMLIGVAYAFGMALYVLERVQLRRRQARGRVDRVPTDRAVD